MANDTGLEPNKLYKDGDTFLRGSAIINSDHPYRAVDGAYDGDPSEYVVPYPKDPTTGKWLVTIPTFTGELTYNGFWYTPTFNDFDAQYMFIDGKQRAKDPGTYTVTFTLANTEKFMWADRDESHSDRDVDWTIGRASGYITVSADSITFNDKYGQTQISYEAHTSNLEFVSSDPSISATCSNGIIFIKATEAKNGNYTLTVIAPQTATHTEARLVIDVAVVFTSIGSDLYLTERTVAYGDQQLQRRWSRINQSIDEICSEVGYQNQQLGNTINSLSRVKINADESKSEIELLCHYDKNGEGADAIIRLRAISDTLAGAIKAHSQIYMAADWIRMEGYTTINGSFQIADSSSYFQTLGYQPGDVFFENAYIGAPDNVFARIGYDSGTTSYGIFGDWFNLYKEYHYYTPIVSSSYYANRGVLEVYKQVNLVDEKAGSTTEESSVQKIELSADGLRFSSYPSSNPYRESQYTKGLSIYNYAVGSSNLKSMNMYLVNTMDMDMRASRVSVGSGNTHLVALSGYWTSASGEECNGVSFKLVSPTLPSRDMTYPPQLKLEAVNYTADNKFVPATDNAVGVWQPGRLIIGETEHGIRNSQGYTIATKASIDGSLSVYGDIYVENDVHSQYTLQSSDRRVKTDIEELDSRYIDLFDNLDVVRFKYVKREDGRVSIGLIAQDVILASDKSGIPKEEQGFVFGTDLSLYSLDYNQLAMLTMFKVKEIEKNYKQRISTLEAKIDTLLREKGE